MPSTDFTISDVLAFALTKPAGEVYSYYCDRCAIGQFIVASGRSADPSMGDCWWREQHETHEQSRYFPEAINIAAEAYPRTFGALATRLEALEPKSAWTRSDAYLNDLELARA